MLRGALGAGALGVALCSLGCPQLLEDEFISFEGTGGASSGGSAAGSDTSAGTGGAGGSGVSPAGSGGAGGAGVGGSTSQTGTGGTGGAGGTGTGTGGTGSGGTNGAPRCTFGEFSAPELITGLGRDGALYGPALSGNGLVLAFSESVDDGPEDIFLSQRTATDAAFGAAAPATGVNTPDAEGTAFLTSDALTLYFSADRAGGPGGRDLYRASRADASASFGDVRRVEGVNGTADDHMPWLSPDERTIYFASNREGADGLDLWMATRYGVHDGFEPPREVPGVNSAEWDGSPSLSSDQRVLVFCSARDGGAGSDDIWMATREDPSGGFGAPEPVSTLNSAASELNVSLSSDGREIIFSSSRSGVRRLYRSVRGCD